MARRLNDILVWLVVAGLFVPLTFQYIGTPFSKTPLAGEKGRVPQPSFRLINFLNGSYQDSLSAHAESKNGLRLPLVRLKSQVLYTLINDAPQGVIAGESPYLYTEDYLRAWSGLERTPDSILNYRFSQLLLLNNWLQQHQKKLLFVFAPGKASFHNNGVPRFYKTRKKEVTDYTVTRNRLLASGIPFIDLNAYFLKLKDTSTFALFPKQGVHWSVYGAAIGFDSITKKIAQLIQRPLMHPQITGGELTTYAHSPDDDLLQLLNLTYHQPVDTLFYPWYTFTDTANAYKPRILFIGDSYVFTMLANYLHYTMLDDRSKFWWQSGSQWDLSSRYLPDIPVSSLNIRKEVLSYDVIVFVWTEIDYTILEQDLYKRILASAP